MGKVSCPFLFARSLKFLLVCGLQFESAVFIGSVGFKKEIEGLVCVIGGLRFVWVIVENLSFSHILVCCIGYQLLSEV